MRAQDAMLEAFPAYPTFNDGGEFNGLRRGSGFNIRFDFNSPLWIIWNDRSRVDIEVPS